jgi:prophage regulatory protein
MRLLRLKDVRAKCGIASTQVYKRMAEGTFPQSVRIGERQVAWVESELDEWIAARVAERHDREPCESPYERTKRKRERGA